MGYEPPARDEGQFQFIKDTAHEGVGNVEKAFGRSNEALQSTSGLIPTLENAQRQEMGLGRKNAQLNAILTKGESLFSQNAKKMLLKNRIEEQKQKFSANTQAFNLTGRELSFFKHIEQQRKQAAAQEAASRNAVIRGVIGTIGMVAGAVIGGPAGAMAGSQAGNLLIKDEGYNDASSTPFQETRDRMNGREGSYA